MDEKQELLAYAALENAAAAVEAERHRLAGLLQTSVIEPLNLLLSQANVYEQTLGANPTARMAVSVLTGLARQALQRVRDLEANLHPTVLDALGLEPALEALASQVMRAHGLQITLARWDGAAWAYHLPDALGSVRQVVDGAGAVTTSREWTPYGVELALSGVEGIGAGQAGLGYAGEWWDAGVGLQYLRARWYDGGTGRFTRRDPWEGDLWQPRTLLRGYVYASDNPVNSTDPTGQYGQEQHYKTTLEAALFWYQGGILNIRWPLLLAGGAAHLDDPPLWAFEHGEFHFTDMGTINRNWLAVMSDPVDPFLAGCVIHQIQDWYTHWNEGYTDPMVGHAEHSIMAWTRGVRGATSDFFFGRHFDYLSKWYIDSPFPAHPEEEVKNQLRSRYPGEDLNQFNQDELIELYLREFTTPGSPERDYFGYHTDLFFEFTRRDRDMVAMTKFVVGVFYRFSLSRCGIGSDYEKPSDEEIIRVLTTGDR